MAKKKNSDDRIALTLYVFYVMLLLTSVVLVGRIVYIQFFFNPNPKIVRALTPKVSKEVLEPVRGSILDCEGRLIAMSYPTYELHLDCTASADTTWNKGIVELSKRLAATYPEKTADQFLRLLRDNRRSGNRYLLLGKPVDMGALAELRKAPILKEGRNKGGLIVTQKNVRRYPYGSLARRTIGFVRDNTNNPGITNNYVGIEGKYNSILHGVDGIEWLKEVERGKKIHNSDSVYRIAEDGTDIVTTLNIDYQDLADRSLREQIIKEDDIKDACLVMMEVKTGAIKAMVNLSRNPKTGRFEEIINTAVGHRNEPGSVFKTVTLLSLLADGRIKSLDETIPTNHGKVENTKFFDQHIVDHERAHKTSRISIIDGFKISSNYVFATLAIQHYGQNPKHFVQNIYSYKLGETFDFDIDGLASPVIPQPYDRKYTNYTVLGSMAFGYATEETPLHILNFYNAIANKGKMMKPYLVKGPSILNSAICTKAVADTVTRALRAVTEEGTAKKLKDAKCSVAGKTGTSFGTFEKGERGATPYVDRNGNRKYQGTFVGFFPAEDPQYSIICSIYSKPTKKSFQGGGIPALAVKGVIDGVYNIDPYWQKHI